MNEQNKEKISQVLITSIKPKKYSCNRDRSYLFSLRQKLVPSICYSALQQITGQMRGNLSFCANGRQVASKNSDCKDTSNCLQNINIQNCSSGEKFSSFYPLSPTKSRQIKRKSMIELSLKLSVTFTVFFVSIFSDFDLSVSFFQKSHVKTKTVTSTLKEPCGLLVPACSAHAQVASYSVQGKYRSSSFWS